MLKYQLSVIIKCFRDIRSLHNIKLIRINRRIICSIPVITLSDRCSPSFFYSIIHEMSVISCLVISISLIEVRIVIQVNYDLIFTFSFGFICFYQVLLNTSKSLIFTEFNQFNFSRNVISDYIILYQVTKVIRENIREKLKAIR